MRFAHPLALALLVVPLVAVVLGRKRLFEWILPALAAASLIVGLAGPEMRHGTRSDGVVVLLDRSPSVTVGITDAEVEEALSALRDANPHLRFGVTAFASRAVVVERLADEPTAASPLAIGQDLGEGTNLAAAVRVALAALPGSGAHQMVLAGDGRITDDLLEAVTLARAANVPISVLPLGRSAAADAAVVRVSVPAGVEVGRPFQIVVDVESATAGEATLALYRGGDLVSSARVLLGAGLSRFEMRDTLADAGGATYRAVVKRSGDLVPENDAMSAFTETVTRPGLLVVSPAPPPALLSVLAASGKLYATRSVLPPLEELADYREILLTGVALDRLTSEELQTLRSFVADLGGGLLVAEGESEPRGARAGGIEDLLPITYSLPQRGEEARLAVVYVVDRSSSMAELSRRRATKFDVVREVIGASLGLLDPDTLAGVMAFDREFWWLRRIGPVLDGSETAESLRMLDTSGGTDLYHPMVAALDALDEVSARAKHLLLLSDGKTSDEPREWQRLFTRLEEQPTVRVSVIAVGPNSNRLLLDRLAQAGHGEVHVAIDLASLPQISMDVTRRFLQSRYVREETAVGGLLATGDLRDLPPLQGFALTYARPTADVLLSAGDAPILARWRLGLGRAAILNTDLAGDGSRDWLAWDRAPLLVESVLASIEAETRVTAGLGVDVDVEAAGAAVRVEAREDDGSYANFLNLDAVLLPHGTTTRLLQSSAGLYEGLLEGLAEGAFAVRVVDRTRARETLARFAVPYGDEYRGTGIDEASLSRIAQATGGRVLTQAAALPEVAAPEGDSSFVPVHWIPLVTFIAVFLLELARRKLPRRATKPEPPIR